MGATGTPKCFKCPSQHARPPQISRNECARPNWQNNMAINWPQLVKPRACRSALCCLTAFSNPPRENSFNTWEKMLHTFIEVESPVVELVLAEPNQPIRGLSLLPAATPSASARSYPANLDSNDCGQWCEEAGSEDVEIACECDHPPVCALTVTEETVA